MEPKTKSKKEGHSMLIRKKNFQNHSSKQLALKTLFVFMIASIFFMTSTSLAQTKEPIKLGFIIPLTGPFGTEARDQEAGGILAVEEYNAKGGLLGRKVELLIRDDKLKPDESARRAKELLEKDKVDLMAGSLGAHTQLAINEQCKLAKTIFMSVSGSNEVTMAPDVSPYTFAEGPSPFTMSQAGGPWIFNNLGKKWFYLVADYSFGWQLTDGFRRIGKKLGVVEAGEIKHPLGTTDFTAYFPKILAAEPDVLILNNFGKDHLNSVKQAHEFGLKKKMKIYAPIILFTSRLGLGDEPYEDVQGGTVFYWGLADTLPSAKAFVANFNKRWGRPPSDYAGWAYSGVRGLLSAVERAGTLDTKKVILALEGHVYDHYKGKQWFRPWDHRSIQDFVIIKSKSAKERTGQFDVFKIVDIVKGNDNLERSAEEMGLKVGVPLSSQLK
jgi:branched-chain amino acid transport system substrate-binding protein